MKRLLFFLILGLVPFLAAQRSSAESFPNRVDVCVYGGTPSGMVAAVTAKQEGMTVALIEPSRWLGGILGAGLKPLNDCPEPRSVGGLTKSRVLKLGNIPPVFRRASLDWMREENIPVLYEHRIVSAVKRDGKIERIRLEYAPPDENGIPAPETDPARSRTVDASMFIDASYEGDLLYHAGVAYAVGREPRERFDEEAAGVGPPTNWTPVDPYVVPGKPESGLLKLVDPDHGKPPGAGDDYTQAYNYRFYVTRNKRMRTPLGVPDNYSPADYELLGRYVEHLVATLSGDEERLMFKLREIFPGWLNDGEYNYKRESLFSISPLGVSRFYQDGDWTVRHRVWKEHRDYLKGVHHFLSTDSRVPEAFRRETAEYGLNRVMHEDTGGWPNQLYVRISRRMQGEAVLDLHDVWNRRTRDDGVGLALYGVDTYPVRRYVARHPETGQTGVATEGNMFIGGPRGTGVPYAIPYGAIVPKKEQCTNLLVPICFSATYIAYASARMEPVFGVLGESAAVAAVDAIRRGVPVQDIDRRVYRKRLLERKQVLEWVPAEVKRPPWIGRAGKNLALDARASVSSRYRPEAEYDASYINDGRCDTDSDRGRWVSGREDPIPYAELRFDRPVEVNAFWVTSGQATPKLARPNITSYLLRETEDGQWVKVRGSDMTDNEEIGYGTVFPAVRSSAFRLVVTGLAVAGPHARVWEWELYHVDD